MPLNENLQNFWTIENVNYRNKIYEVDLLKTFLDNRNRKTQDDWVEFSKQAQKNNDFYVGDMPLYHSVFTRLYDLKDKPETNKIRSFLKKQLFEINLSFITLTRIKYQSKGFDKIIHNYNMPDEYLIEDDFVGSDEDVKDAKNKMNYKSLLDSSDSRKINLVYNWIAGEDIRLLRLTKKPKKEEERIAYFGNQYNWIYLNCWRHPSRNLSALGVRIRENEAGFHAKSQNT